MNAPQLYFEDRVPQAFTIWLSEKKETRAHPFNLKGKLQKNTIADFIIFLLFVNIAVLSVQFGSLRKKKHYTNPSKHQNALTNVTQKFNTALFAERISFLRAAQCKRKKMNDLRNESLTSLVKI